MELTWKVDEQERTRTKLIEELRQAHVDEDNWRNRFHTYEGLRNSQLPNIKV